jgi:hypothetical protein
LPPITTAFTVPGAVVFSPFVLLCRAAILDCKENDGLSYGCRMALSCPGEECLRQKSGSLADRLPRP